MTDWIRQHEVLFWTITAASILMFVGSLITLPFLVARIPEGYFAAEHRHRRLRQGRHPVIRVLGLVLKNLLGVVFVVAGIGMLVLPGQGLITILIGVLLMDFPGKYEFERWLVGRRAVRRTIDWMRRRAGRPPLRVFGAEGDPPPARDT